MIESIINWLREVWNHFKPIVFIYTYESAVVFRAGKSRRILKPNNWYFRIPFLDDIIIDNVALDTMSLKEVNVTTLDGKTITLSCEFDVRIVDIYKAIALTNDWKSNLIDISRGIISDYIEDCNWEEIRKKTTKNAIEKRIQKKAETIGVEISDFNFTDKVIGRALTIFK
jgi:regulator of protease activity HflC (stomatin/prohibitin superfamily)